MNKYQEGIALLREGKLLEAYQYFANLLKEDPKDENAWYLKIQVMQLMGLDQNRILNEYFKLAKIMKNLTNEVYYNIATIYNEMEEYDNAIKYAKKGLVNVDENSIRCRYMIAVAHFLKGGTDEIKKSLEQINICISETSDEDELEFLYSLKVDDLCYLELYDDIEKLLNELYFKIGKIEFIKRMEIRVLINRDGIESTKNRYYEHDYLQEARKKIEDYLNMTPSDYEMVKQLFNVLIDLEDYEEAQKVLKNIEKDKIVSDESIIKEELFLARELSGIEGLRKKYQELNDKYKENNAVSYYLAYYLEENAKTYDDFIEVRKYAKESYDLEENELNFSLLVSVNQILKNYDENIVIIKERLKDNLKNGRLHSLLASAYFGANYPYDMILEEIEKAYSLKYLDTVNYVFDMISIVNNPKHYKTIFNKIAKNDLPKLSQYHTRKMIIAMAYGLNYSKIDYIKALDYIEKQEYEKYELSCLYGLKGRIYELSENNNDKAFECYQKGYEIYLNDPSPDKCTCAIAYMAHSYLLGIGVEKNIEKAKELIINAINKYHDDVNGNIIYLYAYLYLTDQITVDYKEILRLLRFNKSFNRFEISREVLIEQICQKNGIQNTFMVEGIKKALKEDSLLARKYYKVAIKNQYYYPFLNSY